MTDFCLEFEKPLQEIRKQIAGLEKLNTEHPDPALQETVNILKERHEESMRNIYANLTPWQRVQLARHPERPYPLDYIGHMCSDFTELHGDRYFRDDQAVVGGFARLGKRKVMIIGTQKGRDMKSNVQRNFGWPHPEGYRKALRLMRLADLANVPIITLIDTPGAFPGVASEERHIGEAIADSMKGMFNLHVPVIVVIIGEGGSGGAVGLGVGNRILILENAYYSVITPEGCAAILWKDRKFAPQAADALKLTSHQLLKLGIADQVIAEPLGGAHSAPEAMASQLASVLEKHLKDLDKLSPEELRDQRYEKIRAMGRFEEQLFVAEESTEPQETEG